MSSTVTTMWSLGLFRSFLLFIGIVCLHIASLDAMMHPFLKADVRLQLRNPYASKQTTGHSEFISHGGWLPKRIGNPHHHPNLASHGQTPVFHSPAWRRHSSRATELNHHLHNLAHKLGIRLHIYGGKKPPGNGEWDGHLKTFKEFGPTKDTFFAHNKKLNDIKWASNLYNNQKHQEEGFVHENDYHYTAGRHEKNKHYEAHSVQAEHHQPQVDSHYRFQPMPPQIGYLLDGTYDDIPTEPDCTQVKCKDSEGLYSFEVKRQKHKSEEREVNDGLGLLNTRFKLKKRKKTKKNLHQVEYEGTAVNYHSVEKQHTKKHPRKKEKTTPDYSPDLIYITERPDVLEYPHEFLKEIIDQDRIKHSSTESVQASLEYPPVDSTSSSYYSVETTSPFNHPSSTQANPKAKSNRNFVLYLNSDSNGAPVISHEAKQVAKHVEETDSIKHEIKKEEKPRVHYFIPSTSDTPNHLQVVKYTGEQVLLVVPKHETPKEPAANITTSKPLAFHPSRQESQPRISLTTVAVNTTTTSPSPKEVNYNPNRISSPLSFSETIKSEMGKSGSSPKITVIGPGDKTYDIVFGRNYHLVPLPHLILEQPVFPSLTVQPAKLGSFESSSLFPQKTAFSKRVGDDSTEWVGYHSRDSGTTIPSNSVPTHSQTEHKTDSVVPSTTEISEPVKATNESSNKTETTRMPIALSSLGDGLIKKTLDSDSSSPSDEKDGKKIMNPMQVLELELSND